MIGLRIGPGIGGPEDLSRCLVYRRKVEPFTTITNESGPKPFSFGHFVAMVYRKDAVRILEQE